MGVKLKIPASELKKLDRAIRDFGEGLEKSSVEREFDKALRRSATPWQNALNRGQMYKKLERNTGGFDKPMGNTKIKGKSKKVYGRRVGPKMKGKSAGWRAHFFASPARQIRPGKRINFYGLFQKKNREVVGKLNKEIVLILDKLANKTFK